MSTLPQNPVKDPGYGSTTLAAQGPSDGHVTSEDRDSARELLEFLRRFLAVVRLELDRTIELQDRMANGISQHAMALMADLPPQASKEAASFIAVLQDEDRIRQRYQGLGVALSEMIGILADSGGAGALVSDTAPDSEAEGRRHWTAKLLESQSLEELETAFARALETK